MDSITIRHEASGISWHYDDEADVLYLSLGDPRPAVGVDIGEGVIARVDEDKKALVGLTLVGIKGRLEKELVAD